ncbi:accessory factor associated with RNA polymerase II [Naganishia albida]|nr:accessory factor associated with RNA polymerase II [Naganishia albida]
MSTVSHDPLNLLRATIAAKKDILLLDKTGQAPVDAVIKASYISLLSDPSAADETPADRDPLRLVLAADTPTRFTTQLNDAGTTYTLAQLAYVYTSQGTTAAEYMKNASVGGVGVHVPTGVGTAGVPGGGENAFRPVTLIDRRVVLEYLLGGPAPAGRILVLGNFEGSLPAAHNPALSTLLAPEASTDASHPPQVGGKRKAYQINQADVEEVKKIRAQEVSIQDRYETLRITVGGKKTDFTALRKAIMAERVKPLREILKTQKAGATGILTGSGAGDRPKKQRAAQQNIILLSSSPTALITMWNVKRFLEDGVYEKSDQAKARQQAEGNRRLEDVIVIYRTIITHDGTERKIKYYALESTDVLAKLAGTEAAWDRVLCVFTTGQAWQFKSYKWSDPRELFKHVRGVYFQLSNDQPHPAIKDWKVTTYKIDPTKRHTDKPTVGAFWAFVESPRR